MEQIKPKLLITGINGYIGSWTTLKALECGEYIVRGTVRDTSNMGKIIKPAGGELGDSIDSSSPLYSRLKPLQDALGDKFNQIELFSADLTSKESLQKAVDGCDYVLHLASPFPAESPKNEDEVINPAVEGTVGILEAWVGSKVKRVVITSSWAAILDYSQGDVDIDETHWPTITKNTTPYVKSKILAEKAAWDFIENLSEEEKTFELWTVNPGLVSGPLLVKASGASQEIIQNLLTKKYSSVPKIYIPMVDVRDVAEAHLKALKAKAFERYAVVEGTYKFSQLGEILQGEFKKYGYKVTHKDMCKLTAWTVKWFNKDMRSFYADWDVKCHVKNNKAKAELDIDFISTKDSLIEMGYSLIDHGFIQDKRSKGEK